MIVLDTCTLVWHLFDPDKLSPKALSLIAKSDEMAVASISIWEIGIKLKSKKLSLPVEINGVADLLRRASDIKIVAVDERLWIESLELDWTHRDPADRLIVALARQHKCPLLTSDQVIHKFYSKTVW